MNVPATQGFSQLLPRSVSRALSDVTFHPDAGIVLPSNLPSKADIEQAERILRQRMQPVEEHEAKRCFAKLLATFEPLTKLGGLETKVRFVAWFDALKDIPGDLWQKATEGCCTSLEWMPKPVQFRAQIDDVLAERLRQTRALEELAKGAKNATPYVREPADVRLRSMIASYRRVGNERRAQELELQLQALLDKPLDKPSGDSEEMPF